MIMIIMIYDFKSNIIIWFIINDNDESIQDGCDKVYISTSDVQMHANYHRKDSAIIQEGFQRYRATEDCATSYCAFAGQRTTHFHCRRSTCNYTFKNKADMGQFPILITPAFECY